MATYTPQQLELYLEHIRLPRDEANKYLSTNDQLNYLVLLQQYHVARIPFDSVALHYSPTRVLSLDPEDLFQKIVVNSRGGYCMEVNMLFAVVLRSLGFTVITVGGRVKHKKWSHMVNIVTVDGCRFLVDVGFGAKEPTHPVRLIDGHEFDGLFSTKGLLQLKHLEKHSLAAKLDPAQRLWVYSVQSTAQSEWEEMYSFTETEFFPEDYELMSYFVSTRPDSWFVQEVIAYRMLLGGEPDGRLIGEVTLHRDVLKTRREGKEEIVKKLRNEDDRVKTLGQYFDINLTQREQRAIKGLVSEIRERG